VYITLWEGWEVGIRLYGWLKYNIIDKGRGGLKEDDQRKVILFWLPE